MVNSAFTDEQLNISNWTKNGAAFTIFSNSFENGVNTLTYKGGDGYERIYTKISVKANTDYEICIRFHSPTGFSFGGYDGVSKEQFFVTTYNPQSNSAYTKIGSKLAESDPLSNNASDIGTDYIMSFNSGSNTELYVSIDFGQMQDGSSVTLVYEIPVTNVNYNSIDEIVAGVANATQLVNNTKYDENSYTISGIPDFVKYKGALVSTIYANGNSWIGFDAESEHFKFNMRDAAMYNLWTEEGTLLDTYRFFRVRWGGVCKYDAYGDPYFQTFDLLIFDTGDVMFYAVDIPTQYYDGVNSFADVEYTAPTADSRYVTFYAQAGGTYRTVYAPIKFVSEVKYLVRDGRTIYTVTDGTLSVVEGDLTADLFISSGVDTIPDGALLLPLYAPEVLCWTDGEELPRITATVQGVPTGTHEIISDNINIGDSSIHGVSSIVAVASSGAKFFLSFDGGSWVVYDTSSGTWIASIVGMSATEFASVPTDVWQNVASSVANMRLKAVIEGTETVTQVKFTFDNTNA